MDRERLLNSLELVSVMSSEKIKPVKLSLQPGALRLESERAEYGDAADEIPIDYDGEPFQIGFNANYLAEVLRRASHGDAVKLELKGPLNPCLIHLPNDPSFLSVVISYRRCRTIKDPAHRGVMLGPTEAQAHRCAVLEPRWVQA